MPSKRSDAGGKEVTWHAVLFVGWGRCIGSPVGDCCGGPCSGPLGIAHPGLGNGSTAVPPDTWMLPIRLQDGPLLERVRSHFTVDVTSPDGELFSYGDYTAVCSPIELNRQPETLPVRVRGVVAPGDSELMSTGVDSHFRVHEICRL